jgi:predicted RNA-binding Zn ribbon-like protein
MTDLPPRPLTGEPLPLDLLNTAWPGERGPVDHLAVPAGVRAFAAGHGVAVPADRLAAAGEALVAARDALRDLVEGRVGPEATARAAAIASHGRIVVEAGEGGPPSWRLEADDVAWTLAVRAVVEAVDLVGRHGDRVRQCDHPACVLWFLDTSRRGARRWHAMATCGNRAKARRHYERGRAAAGGG